MKKTLLTVTGIWLMVISLSMGWNLYSLRSEHEKRLLQATRTLYDQMVVARQWNSFHNGVYVKITDQVQPNPHLKDPERDLSCSGFSLTKINPAFMTRLLSERTGKELGIEFRVPGLNPLNPSNTPDEWEKKALIDFTENNIPEKYELISQENDSYFIYMKSLKAEASCLSCHTEKGYKLNDIVGGIRIKLFNPGKPEVKPVILGYVILGILGLGLILFFGQRLVRAYDTIQHQAVFDGLTNIPNRRHFNDRMAMEIRRARRLQKPLAVIMADIDHFKAYNDFYGHAKGDEVLIRVAQAFQSALKRPEDFCARYGGEEFIVLLPDTDENGAAFMADRILDQVRGLNIPHEKSLVRPVVTVSLGVGISVSGAEDADSLIRRADSALYQAKNNGKDRFEIFREIRK